MSKNNVLLITAPPRDQMTPDFFPALGTEPRSMPSNFIRYVKAFPRYELTSKSAPSPPNLIGCSGQTKSKLKTPLSNLCSDWSEDSLCWFSWESVKNCDPWNFLCTFDQIKDGGKSIMTHYDVIGCVEVGMVQGIQLYLVFENRANGSKVMCTNVPETLTRWWR